MKRRTILMAALAAPLLPTGLALAQSGSGDSADGKAAGGFDPKVVHEGEHVLGKADAPLTIYEYASLTCSHCAHFATETLPRLKEEWLDTGKARLVFRHYPLDRLALVAAVAADCLPGDKAFFAFVDLLFENQEQWTRGDDPIAALRQQAALAGLGGEQFDACIADEAKTDALLGRVIAGRDTFGVASTPTFIINNQRKVEGALDYDDFAAILEEESGA